MNFNDALKEIRSTAKKYGMVFKRKNVTLNGVYLWKLVDRDSGRVLIDNYVFWHAFADCMAGEFSQINNH